MTDTVKVTEGSGNIFADLNAPLTLDDVSSRINTICADYIEAAQRVKTSYETAIDTLSAAIDASPDLDKDAVASIVLGRIKKMMTEAQAVFG
jgi:hypothetical protein